MNKIVKTRLPVLLAEKLIKQNKLSKDTGISKTTICSLYNGKAKGIQFSTIVKLCEYFNCSVGELIVLEDV